MNFNINLESFNLTINSSLPDIDSCIELLTRTITSAFYLATPKTRRRVQGPIITDDIKFLIQQRNAARRRFIRSGCPQLQQKYLYLKQEVENRCRLLYNKKFQESLHQITPLKDNNKKLWSLTQTFKGKNSKIPFLRYNNEIVTTYEHRAEIFATSFLKNHNTAASIRVPAEIQNEVDLNTTTLKDEYR